MTTALFAGVASVRMQAAIAGVEATYQPIFSLQAELEAQGYAVDAAAVDAILVALKALIPTIKTNVAI